MYLNKEFVHQVSKLKKKDILGYSSTKYKDSNPLCYNLSMNKGGINIYLLQ